MKTKTKLLSLFCALMMSIGMQAHDLEPLHVDGRYLKNPAGDIVTLHGILNTPEPGFTWVVWDRWDYETCLKGKKIAIDSVLAAGWKIDYVRLHVDPTWCNEFKADDADLNTKNFQFDRFKKYFELLYIPLMDYFHSKGIYTVLVPPITGEFLEMGSELQQKQILFWEYVSSHPHIKNNAGVMFELANEPVGIKCHQGYSYDPYWEFMFNKTSALFREYRDYWQPIVDIIRFHCDNIVYIPGLLFESDHVGFAEYPVKGKNIGYAVHWYPGWWGNLRKNWEDHIYPTAYHAPIIITETAWGGVFGPTDGDGTTKFGKPLKDIIDDLGNVSWNLFGPEEDAYFMINQPSTNSWTSDPEACFVPTYQWWNEYAKTKVVPTSNLKATSVSFDEFPTTVSPSKMWLAKIKAQFSNGQAWDVSGDAEYTVSDESILTINHGVIRALKEGIATVGVTYTDGTGQTFNRSFEVTSTLFPLTAKGFNFFDDEGSFDEASCTYTLNVSGLGGWSYNDGIDLSSYKYLVFQLNQPEKCRASVSLWDQASRAGMSESFGFAGGTELVINLQSLSSENGERMDMSHIYGVGIWIDCEADPAGVSIKRVFLSNDGTTPASYVEGSCVYADNMVLRYGDEIPQLTYSTAGSALNGLPQLSTTATGTSVLGTFSIIVEQGSVTNEQVKYYDGTLTVTKAPLTVSVEDMTITEGDAPELPLTYHGFLNGDTEATAIVNKPTINMINHIPVGTYEVRVTGGETPNYELLPTLVTLTVRETPINGTDLTACVGISQDDWHAMGTTDTQFAPAVTTNDGRTAQMMETYEDTTESTGELMWQEMTGLPNGDYVVEVFANAVYTPGRGFESSVAEGAEDVAYVEANGQRTYLQTRIINVLSVPWNGFYRINTTVTDGKLRISMVAEKPGTNWHTIQIKRLVKLAATTVTADNKTMVYGDEMPELTYTADGPALDGTPQLTTTATSASPVGIYPITVERGTETNERVVYAAGTLTITEAPLTVGTKDETITEGDAIPAFTLTYDGFRNEDTESTAFVTPPTATSSATRHAPAGVYPIDVNGGESINYNLIYNIGTLTIEEAVFDGTDLTARVGISQDDWHARGTTETQYAPAITTNDGRTAQMMETYEDMTESTGELMWQEVTGLPNGDYVVEVFANAVYTPGRGFESSVAEGEEDVAYIEANGQSTYLEARIGASVPWNGFYRINTTVTDGKLHISMVAEKPGTNWHTIQIKRLVKLPETTVTANNKTMVYGDEMPELTYTADGPALDGTPQLSTTATSASPVGTYPITVVRGTETNERVVYVAGKLTITKAPLTITAKSYSRKQGEPNPEFAVSYEGFVKGETETVLTKQPTISCKATESSKPGEYDIVVSGGNAQNYEFKYVAGKLTVTDADAVKVTAKSYTRVYGEVNPTFEYEVEGVALNGKPEISCEATATSPVGTYSIIIKKGSVTNYNDTYVNGTLTITKAPLTVTVGSYTKRQYDAMPEFAVSYEGFVNGETETVLTKQPTISCKANKDSQPGEYTITVSGAKAENYDIKYVAGKLTVLEPDGIGKATQQTPYIVRICSVGGKPRKELQKGVNVVVMSDGTTRKVVIK